MLSVVLVVVVIAVAVAVSAVVTPAVAGLLAGPGASALAGLAAGAVGAAVGAAAGSIASQGVGMLLGVQKGFSWRNVANSAIQAGATAGLFGGGPIDVGNYAANAAIAGTRAAISNAAGQGISCLVGSSRSFSWHQVVASAAGAAAGSFVRDIGGEMIDGGPNDDYGDSTYGVKPPPSFAVRSLSATAAGFAAAAARGGRVVVQQVATEAFGNHLGNELGELAGGPVGKLVKQAWLRSHEEDARLRAFNAMIAAESEVMTIQELAAGADAQLSTPPRAQETPFVFPDVDEGGGPEFVYPDVDEGGGSAGTLPDGAVSGLSEGAGAAGGGPVALGGALSALQSMALAAAQGGSRARGPGPWADGYVFAEPVSVDGNTSPGPVPYSTASGADGGVVPADWDPENAPAGPSVKPGPLPARTPFGLYLTMGVQLEAGGAIPTGMGWIPASAGGTYSEGVLAHCGDGKFAYGAVVSQGYAATLGGDLATSVAYPRPVQGPDDVPSIVGAVAGMSVTFGGFRNLSGSNGFMDDAVSRTLSLPAVSVGSAGGKVVDPNAISVSLGASVGVAASSYNVRTVWKETPLVVHTKLCR